MNADLEALIAAGGEPVHDAEGVLKHVRVVPQHTGQQLHPDQVVGYEPVFDRQSGHRRVLQAITDEVDADRYGPRNTVGALAAHFANDPHTRQIDAPSTTQMAMQGINLAHLGEGAVTAESQVQALLGPLVEKGLVQQREDGTYALTGAGLVELAN